MVRGAMAGAGLGIILVLGGVSVFGAGARVNPGVSHDEPSGIRIEHLGDRTVAVKGRTRIIAFRATQAPETDLTLESVVADESILSVERDAEIVAGEDIGFVRVLGLAAGHTKLTIGDATLDVEVVESRPVARRPVITGPANGAVVWGTFSVGVEVREDPRDEIEEAQLRLGDGTILKAVENWGARGQPYQQLRFEIDADAFPEGVLEMTPTFDGVDGSSVRVRVRHFSDDAIVSGEAEAEYDVERPERFRNTRRNIGRHRDASGGRYFSNAGANPAVCFPVEVSAPGWYQVFVRAAGTDAQGALPTVGVIVDGAGTPSTNGRVLSPNWHRFSVGVPIQLGKGTRVITPFFTNDFYVPGAADRNLLLDVIEVARVSDATGGGGASDEAGMMAQMAMSGASMDGGMDGGMSGMAGMDASNEGENAGPVALMDDPYALDDIPLRVSFSQVYDGRVVSGLLQIDGRCWWAGANDGRRAPEVHLEINGTIIDAQRTGAPRFWVDPAQFHVGDNTVRMIAQLDDGTTVTTPVQSMRRPKAATEGQTSARHHRRFSIHEKNWDPKVRSMFVDRRYPKERVAAAFHSAEELVLGLPHEMHGSHKLFVEALGEHFEGAPMLRCELRVAGESTPIGEEKPVPNGWTDVLVGDVEIPEGPKQLVVAFTNDHYLKDKGDRNLLLQGVILARNSDTEDRTAPIAHIDYPSDGARWYMADAVVGWVADNASIASAELLIDGVATGINASLNLQPGDGLFRVPLRSVEPGEHDLAIRVTDVSGNVGESEPRRIVVLSQSPEQPGPYDRAIHLLNRLGYGPQPVELASLLQQGEQAWLDDQFAATIEHDAEQSAMAVGYPFFVTRGNYQIPRRVVSQALTSPRSVQTRFVQWVENHFSTWIGKVQGERQWAQHIAFSQIGAGRFDELLFASAEGPAMIAYLDQERSFGRSLNENYAREVMELHTVGVHGGYEQEDVTNLAHVLTGWTASLEGDGRGAGPMARTYTFRFDPRLNDSSAQTVMGLALPRVSSEARYDRARMALEMLAAHPSTAGYVSQKLAEHYVSIPASEDLVEDMAETFIASGGHMGSVMRTMVEHEAFWKDMQPHRVVHAMDYGVRMLRSTQHYQPWVLSDYLQRSGFGVYDRATPDGYPAEDASYTNSNAMTQRWGLANDLRYALASLVPPGWRYGRGLTDERWAQGVVDMIAIGLTGRVLGDASNEAALQIIEEAPGQRDAKVLAVAPFIALLPEANMR